MYILYIHVILCSNASSETYDIKQFHQGGYCAAVAHKSKPVTSGPTDPRHYWNPTPLGVINRTDTGIPGTVWPPMGAHDQFIFGYRHPVSSQRLYRADSSLPKQWRSEERNVNFIREPV